MCGVLALPILSKLYVRRVDIGKLKARYSWEFQTKHELALQLIRQVTGCIRALGSDAGFVCDSKFRLAARERWDPCREPLASRSAAF